MACHGRSRAEIAEAQSTRSNQTRPTAAAKTTDEDGRQRTHSRAALRAALPGRPKAGAREWVRRAAFAADSASSPDHARSAQPLREIVFAAVASGNRV